MDTKRISLLALAVLSLFIMVFNIPVNPMQEAYALQLLPITTTLNTNITYPIVFNNWNAHIVVEGGATTTAQTVQAINSSNGAILYTMNLTSSIGSNTKYISGIDCQNTAQIFHSTTVGKLGTEYCVITATGGSGVDRVFVIDATNQIQPGNLGAGFSYNNGYLFGRCVIDGVPQVSQAGGRALCLYSDLNGANHVFIDYLLMNYTIANGVPIAIQVGKAFTRSTHFDTGYTSGSAQPNDMQITTIVNQITGTATNELAWTLRGGTQVALFNIGTISQICTLGTGTEAFGVRFAYDPAGVARWYATTINSLKIFGDATCALQTTLSLSSYDSAGTAIAGIAVGTLRKEIYMYDDQGKLIVVNQTTPFTGITNLAVAGNSAPASAGRETLADNDNPSITGAGQTDIGIAVTTSASKYFIQYWNAPGAGGGGTGVSPSGGCNPAPINPANCIDGLNCELPGNANVVKCFVNTGNPPNPLNFNNSTNVVNSVGCVIAQSAGISMGTTNCNLKTNGVGYILLAISLLLINVLWLLAVYTFGTKGVVVPQPVFVSALLSFSVIATFALVGWTDPTLLIVAIVALIGFTAPKLVQMIRGGGIPAE